MVLLRQTRVYQSGQDGYHTYRIPAVVTTRKGALLAFCEGRKNSSSDTGEIDTLVKRSTDAGRTWSEQQVVVHRDGFTIGNPCPVIERKSGTIWLPLTANPATATEKQIRAGGGTRTAWLTHSRDDGRTWAPVTEITSSVKDPTWAWYATDPGVGIHMRTGRLLVPCDHSVLSDGTDHSHVIYSDDQGRTWAIGGVAGDHTDESQVAELSDGTLLLNMRSYAGRNRRAIARSRDGGLSWSKVELDETLIEPVCQASLVTYAKDELLFSNPADTVRDRMTVRLSRDGGRTWPVRRLLHGGPAAYSCLTVLHDRTIGCLYERGNQHPYEEITFARFNLDWLTEPPVA